LRLGEACYRVCEKKKNNNTIYMRVFSPCKKKQTKKIKQTKKRYLYLFTSSFGESCPKAKKTRV
jgi:hypothetical protein